MKSNKNDNSHYVSWKRKWDFLFTTAGWSVGLGNIWRFSFVCYKHGGGVFLIPYLLFAVFLVFPLYLIEASLGQWKRQGMIKSWSFIPILKGMGFAQLYINVMEKIYYAILLVWISKYFVASFSQHLPWNSCERWGNATCRTVSSNTSKYINRTLYTNISSAGELFWNEELLAKSDGIENIGSLRLENVLYLAMVSILVYLTVFKGANWATKVAYFTATLPAVLIIVVLIRAVTLDGASDGIIKYLWPDFSKLIKLEVWTAASTQILFSAGPGLGVFLSLRSHNNYHDDFFRDGIIIIMSNILTSFFSGLATFSTLGYMANYLNSTVDQVVDSGFALAFITYPETLSLLPLPQFWCALFFVMLFLLGFDSQFAAVEVIVDSVIDLTPSKYLPRKYTKEIVSLISCIFLFLFGLLFITQGGIYVFELINHYVFFWNLLLMATFSFIGVGWLYGAERYWIELEKMIGPCRSKGAISFVWKFAGPVMGLGLTIYTIASNKPLTYGSYKYPLWANVVGQLLCFGSISLVLIAAVHQYVTSKMKFRELLRRPSVKSCEEDSTEEVKHELIDQV